MGLNLCRKCIMSDSKVSSFSKMGRWLPVSFSKAYGFQDLRSDALAGMTVSVLGVPQSMAYAMIAGAPPIYGLYTSIVSCLIGAIFGSSRHLITGPTNASCWLLYSIATPYITEYDPIEIILLLTFLTGVVKLVFGLFRMGGIVRYVSNSVVVGLTAGAGILIFGNQIKNILGVNLSPESTTHFYSVIIESVRHLPETNVYDLIIGLLTAAIMIAAKRIHKSIPGPLVGIVICTVLVYLLGWDEKGMHLLRDISDKPMEASLALFHFPAYLHPSGWDFGLFKSISSGAVALAILGLVEASSSSRSIAAKSGQRIHYTREFIAQGLANMTGAFFMNHVSSGSFVRSALNYQAGARTRMSAVFSALCTAGAVLLLAPLINYIPKAALAGMLMVIASSMVQKKRFTLAMQSGGASTTVLFATLASTLLLPLQYAIFVGVFLSVVFLLRITGRTDLTLLVPREGEKFEEVPADKALKEPVVIVNMEGDLYFAAVENLDVELHRTMGSETRVLILRMKRLRALGSSALALLDHFYTMLRENDKHMVVCGIEKSVADKLIRSGLRDKIGEQNIFYADNTLLQSTQLALARARGILEMEKRRLEEQEVWEKPRPAPREKDAGDLMSRQCIRFGEGHTVREAVWLLSEMQKRIQSSEAPPLFLQNSEGKLAGMITPWRLLEKLTLNLDLNREWSEEELGNAMAREFSHVIGEFSKREVPEVYSKKEISQLLQDWVKNERDTLPVLDQGGRVIGNLTSLDLVFGLAGALGLTHSPEEKKD